MRCANVDLRIEARAYLLVLPGLPRHSLQTLPAYFQPPSEDEHFNVVPS